MLEGNITQKPYFPLFDHIMEKHNLKNDARLYEFFDKKISRPDISKFGAGIATAVIFGFFFWLFSRSE